MPGMRMAKATPEDINGMRRFFDLYEYVLEHGEINGEQIEEDWGEDEAMIKELRPFIITKKQKWARGSVGDFDYFSFFEHWIGILRTDWRRVVWGCEILIESVCDPQKDYLDYSPYLEELHVAPEM